MLNNLDAHRIARDDANLFSITSMLAAPVMTIEYYEDVQRMFNYFKNACIHGSNRETAIQNLNEAVAKQSEWSKVDPYLDDYIAQIALHAYFSVLFA